ncbi:hypothetical protein Slin14017_G098730 [Septoria linicola]|nr:hypothetical protein Slin14017_G098730 [Septoria linicola]
MRALCLAIASSAAHLVSASYSNSANFTCSHGQSDRIVYDDAGFEGQQGIIPYAAAPNFMRCSAQITNADNGGGTRFYTVRLSDNPYSNDPGGVNECSENPSCVGFEFRRVQGVYYPNWEYSGERWVYYLNGGAVEQSVGLGPVITATTNPVYYYVMKAGKTQSAIKPRFYDTPSRIVYSPPVYQYPSTAYTTTTILSRFPVAITSITTRLITITSSVIRSLTIPTTLPDSTALRSIVQTIPTTLISLQTLAVTSTIISTQQIITVVPVTDVQTATNTISLQTTLFGTYTTAVLAVATVTPTVQARPTVTQLI